MATLNQIVALEKRKREARENMEQDLQVLKTLSPNKPDGFVSTIEITNFFPPNSIYENHLGGKIYQQNVMSSTVTNWLKRLVEENKVETKLNFGKKVYKPMF